ncbi:MAG: ferritin-like domain-containing protein [Acidimicrobiia bacterium]
MATTEDFKALGRDDANDIASILADDALDFGDLAHTSVVGGDAIFTWDYERTREALGKLYERAKTSQWNGSTDLDWSIEVDVEAVAREMQAAIMHLRERLTNLDGSPLKQWDESHWTNLAVEAFNWRMSQFLHGEQGALVCTAKIVETVPWIDAKYYASTQVMDEARHVEVFSRYLDTKLDGHYPVNPALQLLIDDIVRDDRWDMTYMGMQIMIEGLALAAFGFMQAVTQEPLLKQLLRYVMSDEARHVAFGVLSLQEYYRELSGPEIRERQEFAFEAGLRMRDRLMMHAVWEKCGIDRETITKMLFEIRQPGVNPFQAALFSKIVPNVKKLGLLDAGDGWLRQKYTEIGVIEFEDAPDTEIEYALLDAVSQDRAAEAAGV